MAGVREQALAKLTERQSQERAMVRALGRRLDVAHAATEAARESLARAEAARAEVLVEWVGKPGWTVEAVAEHTGLPFAEVQAATRSARGRGSRRRPGDGPSAAVAGGGDAGPVSASGR
jgi:hypothetical protein